MSERFKGVYLRRLWLPGAVCLLQEVGESKLVLEIGQTSLQQHQYAKPYTDDLILSMALAECAVAKIGFEKKKAFHGFEAVARAECLLRNKPSLAKMTLLSQAGAGNDSVLHTTLTSSSSPINVFRRPMPMEEAETIVRQWQTIKAEALGPSHEVNCLDQVLEESMLPQWKDLANAAKERSYYWRIRLLKLSIIRADILSYGNGADMAGIEALLEEASELTDGSQQKNPNYYLTYKVKFAMKRQDDGSWKFCENDITEAPCHMALFLCRAWITDVAANLIPSVIYIVWAL